MESFTFVGFLLRLAAAIALVLLTFNPTGHSYFHWLISTDPLITPPKAIAGLTLLVGWLVYLRATMRAIGLAGIALALAFFGAIVWLFASWGWFEPDNATALSWIVLLICAFVLAIGISWSHVRRRLTGQADVDEVEEK